MPKDSGDFAYEEWGRQLREEASTPVVTPAIGSWWRHTNGNTYTIVDFTNVDTGDPIKYPVTVVYRNTENGKLYSRPLSDWHRALSPADH